MRRMTKENTPESTAADDVSDAADDDTKSLIFIYSDKASSVPPYAKCITVACLRRCLISDIIIPQQTGKCHYKTQKLLQSFQNGES